MTAASPAPDGVGLAQTGRSPMLGMVPNQMYGYKGYKVEGCL
jgi:hypothetical protein